MAVYDQEQLAHDTLLWELDMERQYEDHAFFLDQVNQELQIVGQAALDAEVEQQYDEYLAALLREFRG
jgi:hypothetical protein